MLIFVLPKTFLGLLRLSNMNLIKGLASTYLALLLVLQPILPFIEYAVFKQYIVDELCVEKDVENSCCKGKCFLEEKVTEANNQKPESENKSTRIQIKSSVFVLLQNTNLENTVTVVHKTVTMYTINAYHFYSDSIFHPPKEKALIS